MSVLYLNFGVVGRKVNACFGERGLEEKELKSANRHFLFSGNALSLLS